MIGFAMGDTIALCLTWLRVPVYSPNADISLKSHSGSSKLLMCIVDQVSAAVSHKTCNLSVFMTSELLEDNCMSGVLCVSSRAIFFFFFLFLFLR